MTPCCAIKGSDQRREGEGGREHGKKIQGSTEQKSKNEQKIIFARPSGESPLGTHTKEHVDEFPCRIKNTLQYSFSLP